MSESKLRGYRCKRVVNHASHIDFGLFFTTHSRFLSCGYKALSVKISTGPYFSKVFSYTKPIKYYLKSLCSILAVKNNMHRNIPLVTVFKKRSTSERISNSLHRIKNLLPLPRSLRQHHRHNSWHKVAVHLLQ